MERKKRLRLVQLSLIIFGVLIIFFTFSINKKNTVNKIISKDIQNKILESNKELKGSDVFLDIEYSGLDLSGNRYILKSKEAINNALNPEIVDMKFVDAIFYFKDDTELKVTSDTGIYNNKTLDMTFNGNIKAYYLKSELFAEKAIYSNSKSFLTISNNVKINDIRGTMIADKISFNIKKQTVDIASFNNGKINASIDLR
jgi:hypothetical protein